jgi:hypothetical protein
VHHAPGIALIVMPSLGVQSSVLIQISFQSQFNRVVQQDVLWHSVLGRMVLTAR